MQKAFIVCGGRDYADKNHLEKFLDEYVAGHNPYVITGGARGADTLACEWAIKRNHAGKVYMADWRKYGKAAGIIRNQEMLGALLAMPNDPDISVVTFPGGRGTAHMKRIAINALLPVIDAGRG